MVGSIMLLQNQDYKEIMESALEAIELFNVTDEFDVTRIWVEAILSHLILKGVIISSGTSGRQELLLQSSSVPH